MGFSSDASFFASVLSVLSVTVRAVPFHFSYYKASFKPFITLTEKFIKSLPVFVNANLYFLLEKISLSLSLCFLDISTLLRRTISLKGSFAVITGSGDGSVSNSS